MSARTYAQRRWPWLLAAALAGMSLPAWLPWVPARGVWAWLGWAGDLALHWQWVFVAAWVQALVVAAWLARPVPGAVPLRRWQRPLAGSALAGAVLLAGNLGWWVLPGLESAGHGAATMKLRVASFNVNLDNPEQARILQWVDELNPDVLALLEVTPAMQPMLDALARRYPHSALRLRDDPFGIAVFARQPLVGARFEQRDGEPLVLAAQLALVDGSQVALRVLHLAPPLNREMLAIRDGVLRRLAREPLSDRAGPGAIAVGDFNATAWTPAVRELAAAGWSRATPLVPTWNFVLPIDHVLATRGRWQMEHSGVGPRTGSDHRPVWADLVLRPAAAPER